MNDRTAWGVSLLSGAILWAVAVILSGGREPWDTSQYWLIYLPIAYLVCALLGFAFPRRTWRWPLVVMLAQFPVMVLARGMGSLWPVGIIMLLMLAVPGMITSLIGSGLRRWAQA